MAEKVPLTEIRIPWEWAHPEVRWRGWTGHRASHGLPSTASCNSEKREPQDTSTARCSSSRLGTQSHRKHCSDHRRSSAGVTGTWQLHHSLQAVSETTLNQWSCSQEESTAAQWLGGVSGREKRSRRPQAGGAAPSEANLHKAAKGHTGRFQQCKVMEVEMQKEGLSTIPPNKETSTF